MTAAAISYRYNAMDRISDNLVIVQAIKSNPILSLLRGYRYSEDRYSEVRLYGEDLCYGYLLMTDYHMLCLSATPRQRTAGRTLRFADD